MPQTAFTPPQSPQVRDLFAQLLARADIALNGNRPWDMQVHHEDTYHRVLRSGSLGLGESYMDGWWDCERIDELMHRILRAKLDQQVRPPGLLLAALKARVMNRQSVPRAWQVGQEHYDLGNDLFQAMLDPYMAYSCGYWANSHNLAQAQEAKLELICQKLQLQPGMRLLDIGCGWGSLMRYAAQHHGVSCVGLTVSREQAIWGQAQTAHLPIRFELTDYRLFNPQGLEKFDRVASVGMFEHVGPKNYPAYFQTVQRSLHEQGLFLLHTIGQNTPALSLDPWIERYIFPNGALPAVSELSQHCESLFVVEDLHNFGTDYDHTLMAWLERFDAAWPALKSRYSERFQRMWRYYLMACAGAFRARDMQLWQWVLSPKTKTGGYRRPLL